MIMNDFVSNATLHQKHLSLKESYELCLSSRASNVMHYHNPILKKKIYSVNSVVVALCTKSCYNCGIN